MKSEFLIGIGILFVIWLVVYCVRTNVKDRKVMFITGSSYTVLIVGMFIVHTVASSLVLFSPLYNPAYWTPPSLFNLNQITGGISIEDILFSFLVGGIVSGMFLTSFIKKISCQFSDRDIWSAFGVFVVSYVLIGYVFTPNPIFLLIIPSLLGGIVLVRGALILSVIIYSALFTIVYFVAFEFFILLFPYFVVDYYTMEGLVPAYLLRTPIYELLYTFSFGVMWLPIAKDFQEQV